MASKKTQARELQFEMQTPTALAGGYYVGCTTVHGSLTSARAFAAGAHPGAAWVTCPEGPVAS